MLLKLARGFAATVAVILVAALVVLAGAAVVTVRRPFPQHDGQVRVQGLSGPVDVWRDARGIPHIEADTTEDLFFAQGYVTAQERFFEMDLNRHIAAGRLSELVGENEDALTADKVVRTLGWRRTAATEARTLPPRERAILDAYSAGVNAYISDRSPGSLSVAYTILGLGLPLAPVERWTPTDSLSWLKAIAWQLSSNRTEEAARALLLAQGMTAQQVDQVLPPYPADHPTIVEGPTGADVPGITPDAPATAAAPPRAATAALSRALAAVAAVPSAPGGAGGIGSNSWVVSGEHTDSGSPLLANDPHLAPAVPSVWFQVSLHCRRVAPECPFDASGFSFAGVPGLLIGRNARIAWGLTTLYADDSDYYLERVVAGSRYIVDGRRRPLSERTETIEVAGGDDVPLTIRSTGHGPIISDVLDSAAELGREAPAPADGPARGDGYEVSLAWTGLDPATTFEALISVNLAGDWEAFRAAAALLDVPGQNLVYADVDGHIGYQTPGRIPVRGAGDGQRPAPGWDSSYDWQGYLDPEDLPSVLDPPSGWIVTANNKVTRDPSAPYLGIDTAAGFRARRIGDLLAARIAAAQAGPLDGGDMSDIQFDDRSPLADTVVPALLQVTGLDDFTREGVEVLASWDGRTSGDSAGAAYAHAVWARLLEFTFHDQLPESVRPRGSGRDLVAVERLLADPDDPWWDDVDTPGIVEGRDEILARALTEARLDLTRTQAKDPARWRWDRMHVLVPRQQPLGLPALPWPVRRLVNLGEVGLGGSTDVVDATAWDASTGSFEVTAVPSMRMVADLGDPDAGTWVNLTGESGHPGSRHYGDQLDSWVRGRTYPWPFTPDAVREASDDRLELLPLG